MNTYTKQGKFYTEEDGVTKGPFDTIEEAQESSKAPKEHKTVPKKSPKKEEK